MDFFGRRPFAELESAAHEELDEVFAEMWTHIKVISRPNFPTQVDTSKQSYLLAAKFTREPQGVKLDLEESNVSTTDPSIVIRSCNLQYPVDRGDRFQRVATGEVFEVTNSNPDTASGVIVNLVQLGLQ